MEYYSGEFVCLFLFSCVWLQDFFLLNIIECPWSEVLTYTYRLLPSYTLALWTVGFLLSSNDHMYLTNSQWRVTLNRTFVSIQKDATIRN